MLLRPVLMPILRNPLQGIADGIRNMLAELLGSSQFFAPLTHSLVLSRGTGSPTFTRATTATGQKWDEAGYLDFTALAGEMVFKGARRERNLFTTSSENFSSGWTTTNSIVVTTSGGGLPVSGGYAEFASDAGSPQLRQVASPLVLGNVYVWSFYVLMSDNSEPNTATVGNYRDFTLVVNGGDISNYSIITNTNVVDSVWRVSYKFTATITTLPILRKYAGLNTATALRVSGMQINDITGETDQTTIRPYVSVGVESAPAYHGSMVDGVKCYDTDRSGNPISTSGSYPIVGYVPWEARTNLCLQSNAFTTTWTETGTVAATQNLVGPDGGTTGWTLTDNDAGTPEGILQTYGALTAANYAQSVFIKKTSGATSFPVIRLNEPVTPKEALCTVDTNNGVATVWTAYTGSTIVASSASCVSHNADWWRVTLVFAATTASWRIIFYPSATTNATQSTGTVSATVTGTCGIYGSQLELGSSASSYIPTTTAAVTRAADVLTYTGGDIANLKTLCATFRREVGVVGTGESVALSDGTTTNYIVHAAQPNGTDVRFLSEASSVTQWSVITAYTPGTTTKMATSFATNDIKMAKDGVGQTPDTVATVPAFTQLNVGHVAGILQLNGTTRGVYGWTRNLSQSELNAITA